MPLTIERPTIRVDVCLNADMFSEHQKVETELQAATQAAGGRQSESKLVLAEQLRAIEEEMAASTVYFHFRALPRKVFAETVAAHPPREGNKTDESLGVNTDTALAPLFRVSFEKVTDNDGELVDFSAGEIDGFVAELTDGQYSGFLLSLLGLNRGKVDAPFTRGASVRTPGSAKN